MIETEITNNIENVKTEGSIAENSLVQNKNEAEFNELMTDFSGDRDYVVEESTLHWSILFFELTNLSIFNKIWMFFNDINFNTKFTICGIRIYDVFNQFS